MLSLMFELTLIKGWGLRLGQGMVVRVGLRSDF